MKIRLLGSLCDSRLEGYLTSFLVDDHIAVDAGSIGYVASADQQLGVKDLLITHSHADHISSLPVWLENTWEDRSEPVRIHASHAVMDCLKEDLFNDRLWPDLLNRAPAGRPFFELIEVEPRQTFRIADKEITAIPVSHPVPTLAYMIREGDTSVLIVGDTGPTTEVWDLARQEENLKAVFLEASFPNGQAKMAALTKHLTPELFALEKGKLQRDLPFIAFHIKARYRDEIVAELESLQDPMVQVGAANKDYDF
ncbi:MAG: 3',5'-cyclic-nucleotide phosphodiesterase [Planctomycetota bacterium]